eukprot:gene8677-biopygen13690
MVSEDVKYVSSDPEIRAGRGQGKVGQGRARQGTAGQVRSSRLSAGTAWAQKEGLNAPTTTVSDHRSPHSQDRPPRPEKLTSNVRKQGPIAATPTPLPSPSPCVTNNRQASAGGCPPLPRCESRHARRAAGQGALHILTAAQGPGELWMGGAEYDFLRKLFIAFKMKRQPSCACPGRNG